LNLAAFFPRMKVNREKILFKKKKTKLTETILKEEDISLDFSRARGSILFLGRYSLPEVLQVLRKKNFIKEAQKRKLWPLVFQVDSSDFPLQRFQIFYRSAKPENLVVDLKIREGFFSFTPPLSLKLKKKRYRFLFLEWLTLQNPRLDFTNKDLPLPSQKHPGLKLSRKIMDLFVYVARLIQADGIMAFPAYFHNAILFSRYFKFINPVKEAEVRTIRKTAVSVPIKQLAWMVHWGCLRCEDGRLYEWLSSEQLYPLNKELKRYFLSHEYQQKVKEAEAKYAFSIDWDCFWQKMERGEWRES